MSGGVFGPLRGGRPTSCIALEGDVINCFEEGRRFSIGSFIRGVLRKCRPFSRRLSVSALGAGMLRVPVERMGERFSCQFCVSETTVGGEALGAAIRLGRKVRLILRNIRDLGDLMGPSISSRKGGCIGVEAASGKCHCFNKQRR